MILNAQVLPLCIQGYVLRHGKRVAGVAIPAVAVCRLIPAKELIAACRCKESILKNRRGGAALIRAVLIYHHAAAAVCVIPEHVGCHVAGLHKNVIQSDAISKMIRCTESDLYVIFPCLTGKSKLNLSPFLMCLIGLINSVPGAAIYAIGYFQAINVSAPCSVDKPEIQSNGLCRSQIQGLGDKPAGCRLAYVRDLCIFSSAVGTGCSAVVSAAAHPIIALTVALDLPARRNAILKAFGQGALVLRPQGIKMFVVLSNHVISRCVNGALSVRI